MGCPLASRKKRIQFFKDNSRWLKAWIRAGQKRYISEAYQNGKAKVKFKDAFEAMGYQLYCDNIEQFKERTYGLFGEFDWKEFLQKEFNIDMEDLYSIPQGQAEAQDGGHLSLVDRYWIAVHPHRADMPDTQGGTRDS